MMLALIFAGGLLLAAFVSLSVTPLVERMAYQKEWTDAPNERKIHTRRTPRVGGVAIVAAFLVGIGYFTLLEGFIPAAFTVPSEYVLIGGLVIAAAGFFDDLYGMHFSHKFAIQLLLALFLLHGGYHIDGFEVPFSDTFIDFDWWFSALLTVVWVVGMINAVNLLDGMDGLAGGVAVIAFVSMAAAYAVQGDLESLILVTAVVGALLGFLYHNFNPASIFMGDTGSLFIGFLMATFSLRGTGHANPMLAFLIPVIALGVPVIDTGLAIVRRFLARKPLFHPDRDHIHHRLLHRLGLSHRNTVLTLYAVSIGLGLLSFAVAVANNYQATLLLCASALLTYGLLRQLGYLRVRRTLVQLRQRYDQRLRRAPLREQPGTTEQPVPSGDRAGTYSRGDGFTDEASLSKKQEA